jgi:hypothetical protein
MWAEFNRIRVDSVQETKLLRFFHQRHSKIFWEKKKNPFMCICTTNSAVKFSLYARTLRKFTAPHNLNPSCNLSPADFKLGAHILKIMAGVMHAYNTFIQKQF